MADDARARPAAEDDADSAGASSPHLDKGEQQQAAQHAAPQALVIHEVVREEGESELRRHVSSLAWSGLAAGLSMGFSFLCLSLLQAGLPPAPWRHLVASFGYSIGFLIVVLGRQQLFTESTLTAVLPLLTRRDLPTLRAVLRLWSIVLAANLAGAAAIAALVTPEGIFPPPMRAAMLQVATDSYKGGTGPMLLKAVFAGWLIALMVWLLPSARSARMFVILLLTYVVSLGRFSHVIAGSVDALFAVFTGHESFGAFLFRFLLPTLVGNTIGGVALVAMLNHAPLAGEFHGQTP